MSKKVQTKTSQFFIMLSIAFLLAALTVPAIETFAESYDCDVNGDGVAGLAEAIYILQLLTEPTEPTSCENGNISEWNFVNISGLCITEKTSADEYKLADVKDIIDALNDTDSKTGTYRLPYESETDTKEWYRDNDGIYDTDGCSPSNMSICSSNFRVVWVREGGETVKYTLTLNTSGSGSGGISCGSDCQEKYDEGTKVTLTAKAAEGSRFVSWTGCDSCTVTTDCEEGDSCATITMNQPRNVTAVFEKTGDDVTVLDAPTNVKATGGDGKVTISWNAVEGAASYHIYWNKTGNVVETNTLIGDIASTSSKHDHNVSTTDTYYYRVSAVDSDGNDGVMSEEVSATPSANGNGSYKNFLDMTFNPIPGRTFYMQTTEVTQGQWNALMDSNPSQSQICDDCPVDRVYTTDIADFIAGLNEQKNGEYRLPTVEEWEYTAKAGGSMLDFTSESTECEINLNLDAVGWYCGNSGGKTHSVAQKQPNEWGLYDMYGNVQEVCQFDESSQVMLGGGWNVNLTEKPEFKFRLSTTGFRLVWIPEETIKPDAPTNIRTLSAGEGNVIIRWDEVVGAESYNIYYSAGDSPDVTKELYDEKIGKIAGTSLSIALENDTTYYFVVTAVNSAEEESDASAPKSATPVAGTVTIPDAPTILWAVSPESGKVRVSWDSVEDADSYNIYFATQSGVQKKEIDVTSPHTVTGLTNDKATYYFVVTAQNTAGDESAESNKVSVIPTTFTNSLGMTFVRIPPGTFMMGSPEDERGRDSDETLHQVTLTKPFFMQTTEVTQKNWIDVTGEDNPAWFRNWSISFPVESVKMEDIKRFIVKMNTLGQGTYRLATEAEWEYAARAGSSTAFANGGIMAEGCAYDANLDAIGWYCGNSPEGRPSVIGRKESNLWGLYDMHGNIWEACQDGYYENYSTDAAKDPLLPASTMGYVIRGGSFYGGVEKCRSASREKFRVNSDILNVGFRLVREAP